MFVNVSAFKNMNKFSPFFTLVTVIFDGVCKFL